MNHNERLATIVRTVADELETRLRDTHDKSRGCMYALDAFRNLADGIATADADGCPPDASTTEREEFCERNVAYWSEKAEYARCGGETTEAVGYEAKAAHWRAKKVAAAVSYEQAPPERNPYATIEASLAAQTPADGNCEAIHRAQAHAIVVAFLVRRGGPRGRDVMGLEPHTDFTFGSPVTILNPVVCYVREHLAMLGWVTWVDTEQPAILRAEWVRGEK